MIHTKQAHTPAAHRTAAKSPDPHHGDLRKAAYLRRRADYRMQAKGITHKARKTL